MSDNRQCKCEICFREVEPIVEVKIDRVTDAIVRRAVERSFQQRERLKAVHTMYGVIAPQMS
jgi:hypothetical protein